MKKQGKKTIPIETGKSSSFEDVARVGTLEAGFPEGKPGKPDSPSTPLGSSSQGWASSAKEELGRFRGVPMVGGLPWRTQYIIVAVILGLSLLTLIGMVANRNGTSPSPSVAALVSLDASARQLIDQTLRFEREGQMDVAVLEGSRSTGKAAAQAAGLSAVWSPLDPVLEKMKASNESLKGVRSDVMAAQAALAQGMAQADLAPTAQDGEAVRELVGLAQVLGSYRSLSSTLAAVSASAANLPDSMKDDFKVVGKGFDLFRSSPLAPVDSTVSRAWRGASSAWGTAVPPLNRLMAAKDAWNGRQAVAKEALNAMESVTRAVSKKEIQGESHQGGKGAWLAGLVALISLGALVWVAWKQQRWQVLSARASSEQSDAAVFELMQDLEAIGNGDLTKRARVSELPVGTLADTINKTVLQLRALVQLCKKTASETAGASLRANEATGVLIDGQRQRIAVLESSGQDIMKLIESVGVVVHESEEAASLSEKARLAAVSGYMAVSESLDRMRDVRERVDEAIARTHRLVASSNEIANMAVMLKEIAEQLEILSMQAALQAAKAGETGQGFRVVAQGVQELAEASGARAKHVTALVETALSDLEALSASMKSASDSVDDGARLTDVAHESWESVSHQMESLSGRVVTLRENTQSQEGLAALLDDRTRRDLSEVEQSGKQAQEASEAVLQLVSSVQSLDGAVSKFKA